MKHIFLILPLAISLGANDFNLYDAVMSTLDTNPKIKSASAKVMQAKFSKDESFADHLPSVQIFGNTGLETRSYQEDKRVNPTAQTTDFSYKKAELYISISENIYNGGIIENSIDEKNERLKASIYDYRNLLERSSLDVIKAYLDIVYNKMAIDVNDKNMAMFEKILNIVSIKEENGAASSGDVNFIKANVDNAKTSLVKSRARYADAISNYEYQLGEFTSVNTPTQSDFNLSIFDLNSSLDKLEHKNALILRNKAYIQATAFSIKAQYGSFAPKIDFQINGESRNEFDKGLGERNKANALINFTYNLYRGGKDEAKLSRLNAKLSELKYNLADTSRKLRFETKVLNKSVSSLKSSLELTKSEVESARKVVDSYWLAFQNGTQNLQALQLAQRNLNRAEVDYVNYKKNLYIDYFKLLQRTGELLDYLKIEYKQSSKQFIQ